MTSYKPVIYAFAVIGVFGAMGLGYATVQAFKQIALMPDTATYNYDLLSGSESNEEFSNLFSTSSNPNLTMGGEDDVPGMTDDSYLGAGVMYQSMQDKDVLLEMKLPDVIAQDLRTLLTRPDTSAEEIYRSDRHLVLKVTTLSGERHMIVVQNLKNGEVYDASINARRNYIVSGTKIVYVAPIGHPADELNGVFIYDIERNQTENSKILGGDDSYTKKVDIYGPIGELVLKNGKVEVKVYSGKEEARFDQDRPFVRAETY